jgi:hypothetical protein
MPTLRQKPLPSGTNKPLEIYPIIKIKFTTALRYYKGRRNTEYLANKDTRQKLRVQKQLKRQSSQDTSTLCNCFEKKGIC